MQGESKVSRPALATLTNQGGSKAHALHDCSEELLNDFFELFSAEDSECALHEREHAAEPGCWKTCDQPAAFGAGPTSRPQCDRPRCRARRHALRQARRHLEKAHLALVVQAWRRQVQLQRAQQAAARHSAQLDGALEDRGELEAACRELEARLEAASEQLAEQRAATAAAEQALHAEKRCANVGTCGASGTGATGTSQLSSEVSALEPSHCPSSHCASAPLEGAHGAHGGRDPLEGARRAAARSLAAAAQRSSRRVAALEAQLEALSQQLAEQRAAAAAAEQAAAAAEQARQASEGEAARRREAEERSVEREAQANAGAAQARRELEGCSLELARLQAVHREAYREINRLRAAVAAAAAAGAAAQEERGAMAAALAAKEAALTELAQLRKERATWLQSVVASHRLGVDEGLELASRRPRPPVDEGLQLGGGPRRCHEGVLEAVLLERRQRRLAAAATCAARDEVEASVESEAWWWEVRLAFALLACAFWSAL